MSAEGVRLLRRELGGALKAARRAAGYSQAQLALKTVGAWLTGRPIRVATLAVAGLALLSGTLAGCGDTAAASRPPGSTAAASRTTSPSAGAAQPGPPCPFLSQRQVAAALGQPFRHVRGCVYDFAGGAGIVGVTTRKYGSSAMARGCLRDQADGHGFKVAKIAGLGPEAESVMMPRQSMAAAVLVRGSQLMAVVIFWPLATRHPQLAVTLLRDAAAKFGRFAGSIQPVC
jgi:hypothetical protein